MTPSSGAISDQQVLEYLAGKTFEASSSPRTEIAANLTWLLAETRGEERGIRAALDRVKGPTWHDTAYSGPRRTRAALGWAIIASLGETCKRNATDPLACLTNTLSATVRGTLAVERAEALTRKGVAERPYGSTSLRPIMSARWQVPVAGMMSRLSLTLKPSRAIHAHAPAVMKGWRDLCNG